MRLWSVINLILGLAVVFLALQIAYTWQRRLPPVRLRAQRQLRGHPPALPGLVPDRPPEGAVKEIAEHNLFDPGRSEVQSAASAQAPAGPPPGVTLTGVRIVGGDREALMTEGPGSPEQRRLREGDEIAGYKVRSIQASRVVLVSPSGEEISLPLVLRGGEGGGGRRVGKPRRVVGGYGPAGPTGPSPAAGSRTRGRPTRKARPRPPGRRQAPGALVRDPKSRLRRLPHDLRQRLQRMEHRRR